jgi:hypothetical protein
MSFALNFALHGRSATLNFGALGCGITPPANDIATGSGQR